MLPACHLTPRLQPPQAPRHTSYLPSPRLLPVPPLVLLAVTGAGAPAPPLAGQAAITRGRAAHGPAPPLKGSRAPGPIRARHAAEEGHVGTGWGGGWAVLGAGPRRAEACASFAWVLRARVMADVSKRSAEDP